MLDLNSKITVKWHSRNKNHFVSKGYKFTKVGDMFEVKIGDLSHASNTFVEYTCDYCLERGIHKVCRTKYNDYNVYRRKSPIQKDCCYDCRHIKNKESNLLVYGVESTNSLDEVRDKQKATNIERYGVDNVLKSKDIQEKVNNTMLERYGTTIPCKNDKIKRKLIKTNNKKYGGNSPTHSKKVRRKQIDTNIKKYGFKTSLLNEEVKLKSRQSLYNNNSVPTSRQQLYIHDVIGGELNFPFNNYSLDIAFPNELIYVECNFGGHELTVKLGKTSKKEFDNKERNRWYMLKRSGWKSITLISSKDKMPYEDIVLDLINISKKWFSKNHSWIIFDFDKGVIQNSDGISLYDFKELKYIYKNSI
jgi:hypothetical protein